MEWCGYNGLLTPPTKMMVRMMVRFVFKRKMRRSTKPAPTSRERCDIVDNVSTARETNNLLALSKNAFKFSPLRTVLYLDATSLQHRWLPRMISGEILDSPEDAVTPRRNASQHSLSTGTDNRWDASSSGVFLFMTCCCEN